MSSLTVTWDRVNLTGGWAPVDHLKRLLHPPTVLPFVVSEIDFAVWERLSQCIDVRWGGFGVVREHDENEREQTS